ncbi:SDR family NAD(P)-dependent oxidoreductase [Streptomyces sp. AC512_CC834]|uniref:SDR family NAD(P)-dependent oxidoreductase n=1 Tax=Streptomyces sp. AC512_CC834 TaxID=2823691 RepID=UPI001C25244B|nr:SDR family NAD(P)-dependent oxidoreductase [Streptomyces sp. AC512_CC834]
MDLQLSGRVAVVTGASRGIGLAVVRTLAEEGALVVAASRTAAAQWPDKVVHVAADLMDPEAPARVVERAVAEFGGVDILVNNAGGPPPGVEFPRVGFMTCGDADWQEMFEFNLFSVVRMMRAAVPVMVARGGGSIVNVSTVQAKQPSAMNVDYGAAKAAVRNMTKAVSQEYGAQGIRANTVTPGPTLSDVWTRKGGAADVLGASYGTSKEDVIARVVPEAQGLITGRMVDVQEIADAVALLGSPRSGSTTGADFAIDAGFLKEM